MMTMKQRLQKNVKQYSKEYLDIKDGILADIYFAITEGKKVSIAEEGIATERSAYDDQTYESFFDVYVTKTGKVKATAGIHDIDNRYDLEEFDVPILIRVHRAIGNSL